MISARTPARGNTWDTEVDQGAFRRQPTAFHDRIDPRGPCPPAADRYHLYVSTACPWAHRVLMTRALKGLQGAITVDVVDHFLDGEGWTLNASTAGATTDRVFGATRLAEIYRRSEPEHAGRITVPVLLDTHTGRIVNNESSEIIRMLNSSLQDYAEHPEVDLYPESLRPVIDTVNDWVYTLINNGVYKAGFARSQTAYETAARGVFEGLDRAEALLGQSRFLTGPRVTEADIRLVTTLFRFDLVYHTHFKCNLRRIADYPNLSAFTRDMYQLPGIAETLDLEHIKLHYYLSHDSINPFRIVPIGPDTLGFDAPHDRAPLGDGELFWTSGSPTTR
jgi:putative glutathione S-transferase